MTMTVSDDGLRRLISREGCVLTAYRDGVGTWTIGVGHSALAPTPPRPAPGMTITGAEAEAILRADLAA
ncbi:MAG: lysozyme, partial [Hyphomicrobiales bacterium]|nr:lysozyme [Hyphomicrobiales bacterium]